VAEGCNSSKQFSPRQLYEDGWLRVNRGELVSALADADAGLQHFASQQNEWYWRFTILKGEALLRLHRNKEALAVVEQELPSSLSASDLSVWQKMIQGAAYAFLRRFEDAEKLLKEAQELAEAHQPSLLGEVTLRKGTLAYLRDNPAQAASQYRQALSLAISRKDAFLEAAALGSLGLIATRQEHYDESIDWDRSALDLSRSLNAQSSVARILGNLGWSYFELGDYDQSLPLFEQAADSLARIGLVDLQTRGLIMTGLAHYYLRNLADARKESERALQLARSLGDPVLIAECLNNLSLVSLSMQQTDLAETYNLEAYRTARSSADHAGELAATLVSGRIRTVRRDYPSAETDLKLVLRDSRVATAVRWEAEARLAKLYDLQGYTARAEQEYKRSIDTIQAARRSVGQDELRLTFLSSAIDFFDDYIDFLVQHGRFEDALRVADRTRSQTLAEGLASATKAPVQPSSGLPPRQVAEKFRATLLLYWLGRDQSYLWVITPLKVTCLRLPKKSQIEPLVKAYREEVLSGRDVLESDSPEGRDLYEMLIAPADKVLAKTGRIIVLPAEGLYGLNFETLIVPQPKPHYWIEDATVSEASSLALLSAASQKANSNEKSLLLLGNPETPDPDFPLLPQAAEEIHKVSMHFPEPRRKVLEGRQATASAYLQSNPERFSYLHFVTHGTASQTRPLESAVILTKEGDSYKLYARDIVTHPLKADLVTISACNGAGTRAYAGEGLVGLSWAFLRAGAHNVIASLWEVSDASSTAQLMDALYRDLDHGADPATALRNAKLFILKSNSNTVFRKPFYWAPFQLYAGS
jgi:CHAT domain-containing protein